MQITEELLRAAVVPRWWESSSAALWPVPRTFPSSCGGATVQLPPLFLYPTSFLFVIEHMMPLCMVISWVYSVAMMIQHIVTEKEHRLKEVGLMGEICEEELVSPLSSCLAAQGMPGAGTHPSCQVTPLSPCSNS